MQRDTKTALQKSLTAIVREQIDAMTLLRDVTEKHYNPSPMLERFALSIQGSIAHSAESIKNRVREQLMGETFPFRTHSSVVWAFKEGVVQPKTPEEIEGQLKRARDGVGREKGGCRVDGKWINVNQLKYECAFVFQTALHRFIDHRSYGSPGGGVLEKLQELPALLTGWQRKIGAGEADGGFDRLIRGALETLTDIVDEWKTGKLAPVRPALTSGFSFTTRRTRSVSPSTKKNDSSTCF